MSKATRHFTTYFSHFQLLFGILMLLWQLKGDLHFLNVFSYWILSLTDDNFLSKDIVITQYTFKNVLDDVPASWNMHMHKHTLVGWWIYPVTLTCSLSLPKCETTGTLPKDGWLCIIIHLALSSARVNAHSVCYEPWPLAVIYSFRVQLQ